MMMLKAGITIILLTLYFLIIGYTLKEETR